MHSSPFRESDTPSASQNRIGVKNGHSKRGGTAMATLLPVSLTLKSLALVSLALLELEELLKPLKPAILPLVMLSFLLFIWLQLATLVPIWDRGR